jgi:hypothetical protein
LRLICGALCAGTAADYRELEIVPQHKLGDSWITGTGDLTKRRRSHCCIRLPKIGPIHQVEQVSRELKRTELAWQVEFLHNRDIVLKESRANDGVASDGAELAGGWLGK